MSSMSPALPQTLERTSAPAWKNHLREFFVVGGLTPLLFPLSWLLRKSVGLDDAEYAVGFTTFYAAYLINDPHFTVTYLLFYKDVKARALGDHWSPLQRLRYLFVGFGVPLILGAWAITALVTKSVFTLSLMIQLMFFLVGWHYVKQGFGVFAVLSARRGIRFSTVERLAILLHCYAGWAYAWASPADPGTLVEEKGVVYRTIAHSPTLEHITHIVFLATTLPLIGVLVQKWRREGRLPIITPLTALLCSVWSWSIYSGIDPLVRYVIPALHSVQYLYFVWLLKGNEAREREGPPFFERSVGVRVGTLFLSAVALGIVLFHAAPDMLDTALVPRGTIPTPGSLGPTPYFAALYAFINIHHYFMDTVIWRRDNPDTRYLRGPA